MIITIILEYNGIELHRHLHKREIRKRRCQPLLFTVQTARDCKIGWQVWTCKWALTRNKSFVMFAPAPSSASVLTTMASSSAVQKSTKKKRKTFSSHDSSRNWPTTTRNLKMVGNFEKKWREILSSAFLTPKLFSGHLLTASKLLLTLITKIYF